MKRFIITTVLLGSLTAPAWADFQTGMLAYRYAFFDVAFRNWTPLAIDGDANAQFYLGEMHMDGMGVPIKLDKAIRFFRQAAEQDHPGAQARLGMLHAQGKGLPQNYAKAFAWYQRAAILGDLDAQYRLGFLFEAGQGTSRSLYKAYQWWAISARWGDPDAAQERDRIKTQMSAKDLESIQKQVILWRPSAGEVSYY